MNDEYFRPGYAQYGPPPGYMPPAPVPPPPPLPPHRKPTPRWLIPVVLAAFAVCGLCGIGGVVAAVAGDDQADTQSAATAAPSTPAADEETTEAVPEPAAKEEEEPELSDDLMEQIFVVTLRDSDHELFDALSDEELILAGHAVCDEIEAEGFDARMVRIATDPGVDHAAAGYLTGAAVPAFCPEYQSDLDAWS